MEHTKSQNIYLVFQISVVVLINHVISFAQIDNSLEISNFLRSPFPTELTSSPVADHVAWVFNEKGIRNIWIAEGPVFEAKQITSYNRDDGQEITNLQFSPDGKHILYVRGGAPNRRGEIPNPDLSVDKATREILLITKMGGKIKLLANGNSPLFHPNGNSVVYINQGQIFKKSLQDSISSKSLFSIRGGASSLSWSPDAEKLAFVSHRGRHSFVGIYHSEENTLEYLSPSVYADGSPTWSPDGSKIAFLRIPREKHLLPFMPVRSTIPWSVMVHDFQTDKTSEVWRAPEGIGSAYKSISSDHQLFWDSFDQLIFPYEGNGWNQLYAFDLREKILSQLIPGEHEIQYLSMNRDRNKIVVSSNKNDIDRQHIWEIKLEGNSSRQVTFEKGIQWAPILSAENQYLAFLSSTGTRPAHPYIQIAGKEKALLQKVLDDYPSSELVEPTQVIFSAADGMKIHGQLFLPTNFNQDLKYPSAIFFHGGSRRQMLLGFHHRGYYHNAYALNQFLARQGYVVLSVNFRSGTGYGMEFREALNYGATGASEINDVLGAGLYLQNLNYTDNDRIGLWGGSYGGYLTALGLAKASNLFKAGVDIHGVHDWNVVIKNFVPNYDVSHRKNFAKLAFDSSPMAYINDWTSPVLIIHGDDDRNVPFSESIDLAESLQKKGVYFEQLIFPDEVHGFLLYKNWLAAFEATIDFFNRKLKN